MRTDNDEPSLLASDSLVTCEDDGKELFVVVIADDDNLLDSFVSNNVFILDVDKNSFVVGDGELIIVSIDDVDKDTFVSNDGIVKRLFLVIVVDEDDELFEICVDVDDNKFGSVVNGVGKNSLVVAGKNSFVGCANSVDSG